jgi:hypothetical protein
MLRHPLETAWPHAKLIIERERDREVEGVEPNEIEEILKWDYNASCGLYTTMHSLWTRHLKPGHLFFGEFDSILDRPIELLCDVLRFIGVDDDTSLLPRDLGEGANATRSSAEVPSRFAGLLREMYRDEIEALRTQFGIGLNWQLPD